MADELVDVRVLGQPEAVARVVEILRGSLRVARASGQRPNRRDPGVRMHLDVLVGEQASAGPAPVDVLQVQVIVTDREALDRVTPAAAAVYLAARGWVKEELPERVSVTRQSWRLPGADAWVMFPPRPGFGDHRTRMSEVLGVLAAVDGRTQLAVLVDLLELAARESEVAGG
jgi:hypothetical protein